MQIKEVRGGRTDIHTVCRQYETDNLITKPTPSAHRKASWKHSEGRSNVLKLICCSHIAKLMGAEFASSQIYSLFYFILMLHFQACYSSICHVAKLYVNGVLTVCMWGRIIIFYAFICRCVSQHIIDVKVIPGAVCRQP